MLHFVLNVTFIKLSVNLVDSSRQVPRWWNMVKFFSCTLCVNNFFFCDKVCIFCKASRQQLAITLSLRIDFNLQQRMLLHTLLGTESFHRNVDTLLTCLYNDQLWNEKERYKIGTKWLTSFIQKNDLNYDFVLIDCLEAISR